MSAAAAQQALAAAQAEPEPEPEVPPPRIGKHGASCNVIAGRARTAGRFFGCFACSTRFHRAAKSHKRMLEAGRLRETPCCSRFKGNYMACFAVCAGEAEATSMLLFN